MVLKDDFWSEAENAESVIPAENAGNYKQESV